MKHTRRIFRGYRKGKRHIREELKRRRQERDVEVTESYGPGAHRSCGRKYAYQNRADAEMHAAWAEARSNKNLYVYKCPICGMWHMTKGLRNADKHSGVVTRVSPQAEANR